MNDRELMNLLSRYRDGLVEGCKCGGERNIRWCGRVKNGVVVSKCGNLFYIIEPSCLLTDSVKLKSVAGGVHAPGYTCSKGEICQSDIPCPTCLPWRALDLCWHEKDKLRPFNCKHCGYQYKLYKADNAPPDLTLAQHGHIPLIVHIMETLGLWDEFVEWHDRQTHANMSHPMARAYTWKNITRPAIHASAEILINGVYRRDAIGSFLQGRD